MFSVVCRSNVTQMHFMPITVAVHGAVHSAVNGAVQCSVPCGAVPCGAVQCGNRSLTVRYGTVRYVAVCWWTRHTYTVCSRPIIIIDPTKIWWIEQTTNLRSRKNMPRWRKYVARPRTMWNWEVCIVWSCIYCAVRLIKTNDFTARNNMKANGNYIQIVESKYMLIRWAVINYAMSWASGF
jgi:G:T-mismatch repair DNA endonuclease (very short patch repair protein)